ncbi:elgicin/penisin family lantibiotic [Paenibacillus elgii]
MANNYFDLDVQVNSVNLANSNASLTVRCFYTVDCYTATDRCHTSKCYTVDKCYSHDCHTGRDNCGYSQQKGCRP